MHTKKLLVWFTWGRIFWEVTKCVKMVTKLGKNVVGGYQMYEIGYQRHLRGYLV